MTTQYVSYGPEGTTQVVLEAESVVVETIQQAPSGVKGSERELEIETLDGGLVKTAGIGSFDKDKASFQDSTGGVTRITGLLYPPYNPTLTTLTPDVSTLLALGDRVHSELCIWGDTAMRFIWALGTFIGSDTSGSVATPVLRNTLTNKVKAIANLRANNTDIIAFATNGQTDDILYTADVSGSGALTLATLIAYPNASDVIYAAQYFPHLRGGINVMQGVYNGVNGLYWFPADAAIPVPAADIHPVVELATADVFGALATEDTGYIDPVFFEPSPLSADDVDDDGVNVLLPFATDGLYSVDTMTAGGGGDASTWWTVRFTLPDGLPRNGRLVGLLAEWAGFESNADDDAGNLHFIWSLGITTTPGVPVPSTTGYTPASSMTHIGRYKNYALEITTSLAYYQVGSATDTWLIENSLGDLIDGPLLLTVDIVGTGASITVSADHIRAKFYYQRPGTMPSFPAGGSRGSSSAGNPNRMTLRVPVSASAAARTIPHKLAYLDFSYDAAADAVLVDWSYPNTLLPNVWTIAPFAGGTAASGSSGVGAGNWLHLVQDSGKPADLDWQGFMGSSEWKICSLAQRGLYLVILCCKSDFTDMQLVYYDLTRNRFYPDTPRQTLLATQITTEPFPYAETVLGGTDRFYSFVASGTDLLIRHEFVPRLDFDPRVVNTSEVLFPDVVYVQQKEMRAADPQEPTALVRVDYLERRVTAVGSSYGTVRYQASLDGGATFPASPDYTADSAFETYDVPTNGDAFKTLVNRISLDRGATTTSGPNGLPHRLTTVAQGIHRLRYRVKVVRPVMGTLFQNIARLEALQASSPVQTLRIGEIGTNAQGVNAAYDHCTITTRTPARGAPLHESDVVSVEFFFDGVKGKVTA